MDLAVERIRVRHIPYARSPTRRSRLYKPVGVGESDDAVRDEFSDAKLFKITVEEAAEAMVSVQDKWMADMHRFLISRLTTKEMSRDKQKQLAVQSRHFYRLQDTLYHKGSDRVWRRDV